MGSKLFNSFESIKALEKTLNHALLKLQRLPENNEQHQKEWKSRSRDHNPEALTHCSQLTPQLQP